jgi:hypothetical protein
MIAIRNVEILSPIRSPFNEEYRFRITFECISPLEDGKSAQVLYSAYVPRDTETPSLRRFLQSANYSIWGQ